MAGVSVGMPVIGATRSLVPGAAGTTFPIERLGIPAIVFADGPAGLRIDPTRDFYSKTYYCTHFPIGISLSSTWDTESVYQIGKAIGEEVRDYGVDILLAPGNNLMRNPLCGRNFEYYSEDPLLSGYIAAAYINGVQSNGVGTSIKHFAFNNQETKRMGNDARMTQRTARELYLRPFEIAIHNSAPWTVMSSYNKINGTFTAESYELLTTILRNEWEYEGAVVTDWFGGKDRVANVNAGNDMIQPGLPSDTDIIMAAVEDGRIMPQTLDANVKRILQLIVKTPRFNGYVYNDEPDLSTHAEVARKVAAEGTVLLKNDDVLPLSHSTKNVAVYGVTSYDIIPGGSGSGTVNRPYTISLIEGLRNNGYNADKKLMEQYSAHLKQFRKEQEAAKTDWWRSEERAKELLFTIQQLSLDADNNDVAIITIGRISGEGVDRDSVEFYLNTNEVELINNVCTAFHMKKKKVVVLLNIGDVIETASWKNLPDAILVPWHCGQEGGNSMADVLSGHSTSSGCLPMTFPIDVADHYSSQNMVMNAPNITLGVGQKDEEQGIRNIDYTIYEEGIYVGYRYFDTFSKEVSYPFGYGLSYTTFEYKDVEINRADDKIYIDITITNSGFLPGKEVVQIFTKAPKSKLDKPSRELKAFAKTTELQPSEHQRLRLTINVMDLASFDQNEQAWVMDGGRYHFYISSATKGTQFTETLKIKKSKQAVNDVFKQR